MRNHIHKLALAAAASAAVFGFAAPASAALQLNSDGSVTVTGTSGGPVTINMGGNVAGNNVPGLTSALTLSFTSAVNGLYTFGYTLANTSTAPTTSARLNAFGFNTNPNVTVNGASILTGSLFDQIRYTTNLPNGVGNIELCFTTHNCAGGGSEGLLIGQSGSGSFSLKFGSTNLPTLTLDNFAVRYQAIEAPGISQGSGTGAIVTAVPEPGTWGLMLFGFGAIGVGMRRRRRVGGLPQMA